MSERILVVDDEPAITDAVAYALRGEGFEVETVGDGEAALERALAADGFDVLVLDQMLPRLSGLEVCRRVRADSDVPILLLTANDAEVDRVLGLESGADDYVTKPFSMAELVSRVRAILRRRQLDLAHGGVRRVDGLEVDLARHSVRVDDRSVSLTPSEFRLLTLLVSEPGRVFGRRELVRHLWDSDFTADARSCDMHISNLRRKIGSERIVTVRGVGYKLAGS
jgi:DNA-binding response OmpR family regulator